MLPLDDRGVLRSLSFGKNFAMLQAMSHWVCKSISMDRVASGTRASLMAFSKHVCSFVAVAEADAASQSLMVRVVVLSFSWLACSNKSKCKLASSGTLWAVCDSSCFSDKFGDL